MEITRRRLLVAGGGATTLGLVGVGTRHWLRSPESPEPAMPTEALQANGWEHTDERVERADIGTIGPFTITSEVHMRQYEHTASDGETVTATVSSEDGEINESVEVSLDGSPSLFTARGVGISPQSFDLPGGQAKNRSHRAVRQDVLVRFILQLERLGFEFPDEQGEVGGTANPDQTDNRGTIETASGYTADTIEFSALYPLGPIEVPVTGDSSVTVTGQEIPVNCQIAMWQPGSYFMSAAGTHPTEPVTLTTTTDGEQSQVDVSLDFSAERREENLAAYLRRVRL